MCGINGIFAYHPDAPAVSRDELRITRDSMERRGPDGFGEWFTADGRVGFGHRRLSIQDLSERGAQPMHSADGQLTVTFNGEIYNYPALRKELEAEGVKFRSTSDTEVLLHLYRRDGEKMVQRLRGMFAFGIWDAARHCMFLARDPFGIKPLYVANDGKTVRFASQVKALLAGGAVSTEPEAAGLVGFFILGSVPEPYTMYRRIRSIPAGSTLLVNERGAEITKLYFNIKALICRGESVQEAEIPDVKGIGNAVRESVKAHLLADVPIGFFLSAGIDSGVLAGIAAESSAAQLHAVTLGFREYQGGDNDEIPIAQQVAALYGIQHHADWVSREDFEAVRADLLHTMDQPSIDGVNTYLVSQAAARQGMKVAISGVGGDELFRGYPSFRQVPRVVRALSWMRHFETGGRLSRGVFQRFSSAFSSPKHAGILEYGHSLGGAYLLRRSLFMPWELEPLLDPHTIKAGLGQLDLASSMNAQVRDINSRHAQVAVLELSWYMRNQLLRDSDWAGMAHSLEIRLPLVDSTLFATLAPLFTKPAHALKKTQLALAPHKPLPSTVSNRPKSGFSTPVSRWIEGAPVYGSRGLRQWARNVLPQTPRPGFRVLALMTDSYGGHGGIAKFNRDLLSSLAAVPGCEEVVCLPRVIVNPLEPIPERIRFITGAAGGKLQYLRSALRAQGQGPFDLVIIGHVNLAALGVRLAKRLHAKTMLFVHGIDAWQPHPQAAVRQALPKLDRVVGVSQVTLNRIGEWSGINPEKTYVLPNCVDLQRFTPGIKPADLVESLRIEGKTVLMTFGRLADSERSKGFDEIIELMPALILDNPKLVYLICGSGPDLNRLKAKCQALGVVDFVRFSGYVPEERKNDYYRLADAYVMPSRGEGFGIVFLEAMACGIPAMGSRLDGGCEALRGGSLGELVDPNCPEDVRAGVLRTLGRKKGPPIGLEFFSQEYFSRRVQDLILSELQETEKIISFCADD